MGRIRHPVGAPGWLWVLLAVAAMGFSLVHTVVDFGIFVGSSSPFGVQQSVLSVLIGVLYPGGRGCSQRRLAERRRGWLA